VVSGTFLLGMGEDFDEKAFKTMSAGAFGFGPLAVKHYVTVKGATIVQPHGCRAVGNQLC